MLPLETKCLAPQVPRQDAFPAGGSSDAGQDLAAEQIDTYLTWGEPVAQVAEKVASARRKAEARGRKLRFGIRLHFIVRETEEEAWRETDRLISKVSDTQIAAAQARFTQQMDSVGQRRMAELHGGDRNKLLVAPNLWAGVGLVATARVQRSLERQNRSLPACASIRRLASTWSSGRATRDVDRTPRQGLGVAR